MDQSNRLLGVGRRILSRYPMDRCQQLHPIRSFKSADQVSDTFEPLVSFRVILEEPLRLLVPGLQ